MLICSDDVEDGRVADVGGEGEGGAEKARGKGRRNNDFSQWVPNTMSLTDFCSFHKPQNY